jgi:aminoglycoside/choline kinase family phosphotransferase
MRDHYLAAFPNLDREAFDSSYAIIGAQRNTRILGTFTRLLLRDGKSGYQQLIPRTWNQVENDLTHPALALVRAWFDRHIPAAARRAAQLDEILLTRTAK